MTIIIEFGRPFIKRPGCWRGKVVTRCWYGFIAISRLNIELKELVEKEFQWYYPKWWYSNGRGRM